MIYRWTRKSVISRLISYLIDAYRVFNHLTVNTEFLSVSPLRMCVYFTFLHLVSYLTINLQFGREATESHSDQKLVISENGQAF
jgi:hypothetical protein